MLLCGVLYAHPSHAVSMAQCPDGTHWYPVSEGVSTCPASVTVTGVTPTATGVTITGTVTTASGTVHTAVRLTTTLLQWRNTTQGTGAEASADDTTVSSGAFSITYADGTLAEQTAYALHVMQYADNRPTTTTVVTFTTLDGTPSVSGDEITGGDDRFYCPDGSDANSGLTNALRKANYPANDSTFAGGDDMWLCNTGKWYNAHHDINRQGTSGNWNEIGSYYMDGATPRKTLDDIPGPGTTHEKAEIRGALTDGCLQFSTCTYPSTGFPVNGYTSKFDGLIMLSATADYTHLRNIKFTHFQYNSVTASGGNVEGALHHLIFDGTDLNYGGFGSRFTFIDGVTDVVLRNIDSYAGSTCAAIKVKGGSSDVTACTRAGGSTQWSGVLVTVTRKSGRFLVEHNTIRRGFGEGINCFNTNLGRMIWRNNKIANTWSGAMYPDACPYVVIESNMVLGGTGVMYNGAAKGAPSISGIQLGCEETTYQTGVGSVARNNLVIGANKNLMINLEGSGATDCAGTSIQVGGKFYGNTSIAAAAIEVEVGDPSTEIPEADFQDNAHWNDTLTTGMCSATSAMTPNDNAWSHNPSDADCDGAGDTIGALGLTQSLYSWWQLVSSVTGEWPVAWPTWADANPAGGSGLIGTGTALTSAILNKDDYGFAYEQIREVLLGSLTEAEWECALCVDAEGTTRANPPSKGAVE